MQAERPPRRTVSDVIVHPCRPGRSTQGDRGFSLVEVLVAIVLIGVLAATVVVGVGKLSGKGSTAGCEASAAAARTALPAHRLSTGDNASSFEGLAGSGVLQIPDGVSVDGSGMRLLGPDWQVVLRGGAAPSVTCASGTTASPLDVRAVPPVAAFGLRRLTVAYQGPLIRVRRTSDNGEMDVAATADGALDTGALLAFVGPGDGRVVRWYDQSGGGRHAVQPSPGLQPRIVVAGVVTSSAGRPMIDFDGAVGGALLQIDGLVPSSTASWFATAVRRSQTSGGSCCRPLLSTTQPAGVLDGTGQGLGVMASGVANADRLHGTYWGQPGLASTSAWPMGGVATVSATWTGASMTIGLNGTEGSRAGLSGQPGSSMWIGGEVLSSRRFAGLIGDVVVYDSALVLADRRGLSADLGSWYGLAI